MDNYNPLRISATTPPPPPPIPTPTHPPTRPLLQTHPSTPPTPKKKFSAIKLNSPTGTRIAQLYRFLNEGVTNSQPVQTISLLQTVAVDYCCLLLLIGSDYGTWG